MQKCHEQDLALQEAQEQIEREEENQLIAEQQQKSSEELYQEKMDLSFALTLYVYDKETKECIDRGVAPQHSCLFGSE